MAADQAALLEKQVVRARRIFLVVAAGYAYELLMLTGLGRRLRDGAAVADRGRLRGGGDGGEWLAAKQREEFVPRRSWSIPAAADIRHAAMLQPHIGGTANLHSAAGGIDHDGRLRISCTKPCRFVHLLGGVITEEQLRAELRKVMGAPSRKWFCGGLFSRSTLSHCREPPIPTASPKTSPFSTLNWAKTNWLRFRRWRRPTAGSLIRRDWLQSGILDQLSAIADAASGIRAA